ncbi:MAG TPA: hypothetical protein DGT23_04515 [Micromonosporaceae bacterium]|nr:hypothetical protein [Micromonosporaceae bacterium]
MTKQAKGGQTNAEIVAGTNDLLILERIGRECVAAFLRERKAAFCKVFGTQADYQARDPRQTGNSVCWAWLIGVPLSGGPAAGLALCD